MHSLGCIYFVGGGCGTLLVLSGLLHVMVTLGLRWEIEHFESLGSFLLGNVPSIIWEPQQIRIFNPRKIVTFWTAIHFQGKVFSMNVYLHKILWVANSDMIHYLFDAFPYDSGVWRSTLYLAGLPQLFLRKHSVLAVFKLVFDWHGTKNGILIRIFTFVLFVVGSVELHVSN